MQKLSNVLLLLSSVLLFIVGVAFWLAFMPIRLVVLGPRSAFGLDALVAARAQRDQSRGLQGASIDEWAAKRMGLLERSQPDDIGFREVGAFMEEGPDEPASDARAGPIREEHSICSTNSRDR